MLVGGQRTEFHMNAILPIVSYTTGVGFPIQFAYRPKATPSFRRWGLQDYSFSCKNRKVVGRKTRVTVLSHCSQPSRKFQHGTCVLWAVAWASAEQWQCQASHEWGEKWSGWNQTNRTGGYGPVMPRLLFAEQENRLVNCLGSNILKSPWRHVSWIVNSKML